MSTLLILKHQGHTQQHPASNVSSFGTTSRTHSTTSSNKCQLFSYYDIEDTLNNIRKQLLSLLILQYQRDSRIPNNCQLFNMQQLQYGKVTLQHPQLLALLMLQCKRHPTTSTTVGSFKTVTVSISTKQRPTKKT